MIGRVRFIHPLNDGDFGYRYKIQLVGSSREVMSCDTHDVYKLNDLLFCETPDYEQGRVPVRRVTNQDIWEALSRVGEQNVFIEKVEVEVLPKDSVHKVVVEPQIAKSQKKNEDAELKSTTEKNKLFIESVESKNYSAALNWLLLGADVDCGVDENFSTLLLRSVSQGKLITTGFLLAVGAHPSSKNKKGVSVVSFMQEHKEKIKEGMKPLIEEGVSFCKSKGRNPKNHQQDPNGGINIILEDANTSTQNQDGIIRGTMSIGDAQALQDLRKDPNDASLDWGYSARDDGGFGSYPLMDDYGDESHS